MAVSGWTGQSRSGRTRWAHSGSWGGSQDLLCEAGGKTWTLKRLLWEGTSWGLQEEGGSHGMWLLKAMTHRK